jgi:RHS repeat-associated protein
LSQIKTTLSHSIYYKLMKTHYKIQPQYPHFSPSVCSAWDKGYRYGFNGKEIDKGSEGMGGGGSTYDYGFRIYNPSLGKFLSVDPLTASYPWYTPYQFAGNKPINCIDLDGLEEYYVIKEYTKTLNGINVKSQIIYKKVESRQVAKTGYKDLNRLGTIHYIFKGRNDIHKFSNVNEFSKFSWEFSVINQDNFDYYESEEDANNKVNAKKGTFKEAVNKWYYEDGVVKILTGLNSEWNLTPITINHSTNNSNGIFNESEINSLNDVANALLSNPNISAEIYSYASKKGSNQLELSKKRAENMKNKILEIAKKKGASDEELNSLKSRITAEGKGVPATSANKAEGNDDQEDRKTTINYVTPTP